MTHEEALIKTREYLHLVGKAFQLPDGETETVKAVVAWEESSNNWCPHVCFYEWHKEGKEGISHMNVDEFFKKYHPSP